MVAIKKKKETLNISKQDTKCHNKNISKTIHANKENSKTIQLCNLFTLQCMLGVSFYAGTQHALRHKTSVTIVEIPVLIVHVCGCLKDAGIQNVFKNLVNE